MIFISLRGFAFEYTKYNIHIVASDKDSLIAENIVSFLKKDIDDFQKKIGAYPNLKTNIYLASGNKDYQNLNIKFPEKIVEFSKAFYSRSNNCIYLHAPEYFRTIKNLRETLLHEYIHSFVYYFWENAPLWFHEGMAVFFSKHSPNIKEFYLVLSIFNDKKLSLKDMEKVYPKTKTEWVIFYEKAALTIEYLSHHYKRQFNFFIDNAHSNGDFYLDFERAFKITQKQFENDFQRYLKRFVVGAFFISITGILWSLIPLGLVIAWIRKRIINKKIYKIWEEQKFNTVENKEISEKNTNIK
jgi:hypothetical protein